MNTFAFTTCSLTCVVLGSHLDKMSHKAVQALGKAILDDLGAVDRKMISKEDAVDEAVETKEKRKRLAKSGMSQATDSGAKLKKPAVEKQPLDNDQNSSSNNREMVAASNWRGKLSEAVDDDDAITMHEIDAEERQEVSICFAFPMFQPPTFQCFF